jgi:hypothetical protein
MAKTTREDRVIESIRSTKTESDRLVHLSTGVTLETKRIPNMIFPEVVRKFKRPEPPDFTNEDTGRVEKNLSDPAYIEAYNNWQSDISLAIVDTMILLGTKVHEIPEDLPDDTDESWTYNLKALGIDPGKDPAKRYLLWVKYVAATADEDITAIMEKVGSETGVSEAEVSEAVDRFRSKS